MWSNIPLEIELTVVLTVHMHSACVPRVCRLCIWICVFAQTLRLTTVIWASWTKSTARRSRQTRSGASRNFSTAFKRTTRSPSQAYRRKWQHYKSSSAESIVRYIWVHHSMFHCRRFCTTFPTVRSKKGQTVHVCLLQALCCLLSDGITSSMVSANLHSHLVSNSVEYLQFSFRWMNNLLMREIPLRCVIRLWDTCLVSQRLIGYFLNSFTALSMMCTLLTVALYY